MTTYTKTKEKARNKAIEWQNGFADQNYSYEELVCFGEYFYKLGKRFGLIREFRENGII